MAVKVIRERPDQRRHHRVTAPMLVTVGSHTLRATDWSLGGLRLDGFPGEIPAPGDTLSLKLSLPFQGFDVAFTAEGEVVRTDPGQRMFALRFTQLGEREQELMRHFIEELVRGSMSVVADTIKRIDVPITPVSTAPDASPKSQVPLNRWPIKTVAYSAFYLIVGVFVFGYAAVMTYSNVFRLEVQTAVISAPMVTVQAPGDGHVIWTSYKPGDLVKSGTVVLRVADNALERDIDLADIEIAERKARLVYTKRQHVELLSQLESLATIEHKELKQAQLKLEELVAAADAAESLYRSTLDLYKKGYATRVQVDKLHKEAVAARTEMKRQKLELETMTELDMSNVGERYFNGNNFVGERAKLEAEIKLEEQTVANAERKKQALLEHRLRLNVVAPFDGLIQQLPRVDRASINRGDVIAVMEKPRGRMVTAYLTQDEALRVGIGDQALVYIPAFDKTVPARVAEIDRTSSFADEMNARFGWRGTRDRSARATLAFMDPSIERAVGTYKSGTPVVVLFESRSTRDIISEIRHQLGLLPTSDYDQWDPTVAQPAWDDVAGAGETPAEAGTLDQFAPSFRGSVDDTEASSEGSPLGASPEDALRGDMTMLALPPTTMG